MYEQALAEAELRLAELEARQQQLLNTERASEERRKAVTQDAHAAVMTQLL